MFDSPVVQVAISLPFLYLLLSVVCSSLQESISQILGLRASTLGQGLEHLLTDPEQRRKLLAHPLIRCLGEKPSYIPNRTFAMALLDIATKPEPEKNAKPQTSPEAEAAKPVAPLDFESVRNALSQLPEGDLRTSLLTLADSADHKLDKLRDNVEIWFDDTMDRVSGWYKRKSQAIVMVLALLTTALVNADTIAMAKTLWQDAGLRQGLVAAAAGYVASPSATDAAAGLGGVEKSLRSLALPIGWSALPQGTAQWVSKVLGLLLTTLAVSLGAPFWFDLLNKFVSLRGVGKAPAARSKA